MTGRLGGPRRLVTSIVLLAVALPGSSVLGRVSPGRVVVLEPAVGSSEVHRWLTRVGEELTAGGFVVDVVDPGPLPDPVSVATAMRDQTGATAVIALTGKPGLGAAELWILDRIGGEVAVHRISAPSDDPEHAPEVLAIRTIEALRASALKMLVESNRAPTTTRSPARAVVSASPAGGEPPPRASRFGVETGVSILDSIDGPGVAELPFIRLRADQGRLFFTRLTLSGLGSRPVVTTPIGSAMVSQAFGLLEVGLAFRAGDRLRPLVTLGAGSMYVSEVGRGVSPFQGTQASGWSAMADAGAGFSVALGSRLALAAEVHVFLSLPHPTIRFDETTAATVGRPAILGSVGLVAGL